MQERGLEKNSKKVLPAIKEQKVQKNSHEAISIVHTCSSRGNFDSSIMQENFSFNLEQKKIVEKSIIKLKQYFFKYSCGK